MKSLSCHDMGDASCNFVATGATPEEVMKKMQAHAVPEHHMTDYEFTSPNGVAKMMAAMKDA